MREALLSTALVAVLCTGGCGSMDAERWRDTVVVPDGAEAVPSLRWDEVESITPLNRQLIVFQSRDRPYLLVLERPCQGLRTDSIVVGRGTDPTFRPDRDVLRAADPPYSGTAPTALSSTASGRFDVAAITESTVVCRPETLYAIRDEDVAALEDAVRR